MTTVFIVVLPTGKTKTIEECTKDDLIEVIKEDQEEMKNLRKQIITLEYALENKAQVRPAMIEMLSAVLEQLESEQ